MLERLQQAAPLRLAAATMLAPASEFGRGAMDELHQQTVSLLSFQTMPRAVYDAQAAYNLLSGFGESAKTSLSGLEARIHRHYQALGGGRWPLLALQAIAAPVFHGHTFSISIELERPVAIPLIEDALGGDHVEIVLEDTDSPSNLAATGQNGILVRVRPVQDGRNPSQASRLWLWAASDNLRLFGQNAVECALELRKLRPQGKVQ
jgi:aspartate-semialdehyde dehydrogenase